MPANPDLLADAFAELPKAKRKCSIGSLLDNLDEQGHAKIRGNIEAAFAADQRDVPNSWILARLTGAGAAIAKDTVLQHRRGTCRCVS